MKVAVFSTKPYDKEFLLLANYDHRHEFQFFEARMSEQTARLAEGFPAICTFVNDQLDGEVLLKLFGGGTRMIALRCAGFNHVDLAAAEQLVMTVARVPDYSPNSISEFTIGMILTLSRKLHRSFNRTREGNFSLDGLIGHDISRKTVGLIGTGKIGALTAFALQGFGCRVIANDVYENRELTDRGVAYVSREQLLGESDIISLHCPLMPDTHHLINADTIALMKQGVMIVNTSRGGLINTEDVIAGLKSGKIGSVAIDVYEEEGDVFYEDYSNKVIQDDILARLLTFPNVVLSSHAAFFTVDALQEIARQTIENLTAFEQGEQPGGLINYQLSRPRQKEPLKTEHQLPETATK
ncbi:MAG: 2-hydroxyacid dehydrogenase [Planctomycetaceae bacterium]|nr:2-hydroxyacid dehydrogenase [Planctomycetaceae bacterium]